jgi:Type IV secretion system pilin
MNSLRHNKIMLKNKTSTLLLLVMVMVGSSLSTILVGSDTAQAATQCKNQYEDWVKADRPSSGGKRAALEECVKGVARTWDNTPTGWCTEARLETTSKSLNDRRLACINWYAVGFFNGADSCGARDSNNKKTCQEGAKSRSIYSQEYRSNNPTDTQESDTSSGGGAGGSSESATSGGGGNNAGGSSGDESKPVEWAGGEVGVEDLKTSSVVIKKDDIGQQGIITSLSDSDIVSRTLNVVYSLVAVIAVIAIIAAGIMIITSDGDAQKVATGRKAIIYASIGLVITASAFIITGIIQGIATK